MKPVDQTVFGHAAGNCFSACVASLLELDINAVPYFMTGGVFQVQEFAHWLKLFDLYPICFTIPDNREWVPAGYYILSGKSPRTEGLHSVIAYGPDIMHDPHPERTGLLTHKDAIILVPFSPHKVRFGL